MNSVKTGKIYGINGPVIYLKGKTGFKMSEMVHVGKDLMGKNRSTTGIAITNVFENISQTHVSVSAGQISDGVEMKLAM